MPHLEGANWSLRALDGICAGILDPTAGYDAHLVTALAVLSEMKDWSENQIRTDRQCEIRLGINEDDDCLIQDINDITRCARFIPAPARFRFPLADGDQIMVGANAYNTLRVWDKYQGWFRPIKAEIKHSEILLAYQYTPEGISFLNTQEPTSVERADPIDLALAEALNAPSGHSTGGANAANRAAREAWENEIELAIGELHRVCTPEQVVSLTKAQLSWKTHLEDETEFLAALRATVRGTMYGPISGGILNDLCRRRARCLRFYLSDWVGPGK